MDATGIRHLEALGDRAWPARETGRGDGWEARANDGLHRRLNSASVWSAPDPERTVARIEDWYRERGLPPLFKLTPGSAAGLDGFLERRGWGDDAPVTVMTAPLPAPPPRSRRPVALEDRPTGPWADAFAGLAGYDAGRRRRLGELLERIEPPVLCAAVPGATGTAAVGMVVIDGDHAGVFEMATHPDRRGEGLASAVLGALLGAAARRGARTAYLQVLAGNLPAERLYASAGFTPAYRYWYRIAPAG